MKQQLLKQRIVLGLMLLCAAVLFTWEGHRRAQEPLQLWIFGDPIQVPAILHPGAIEPAIPEDTNSLTPQQLPPRIRLEPLSPEYIKTLTNFTYLTTRIFLVDPETILLPSDIDVHSFLEADLTIDNTVDGPTVLIFHTHSAEMFTDSNPADPMTGIMGTGKYLARVLTENHGIEALHYTGRFDMLDGRSHRPGSYERMEPAIRQILADNPSIQVAIDLHRDGVGPHAPAFVHYVNGVPTAQIMFFNGLSRQNRNGQAVNIDRLPNPYQRENLNFSFRLQLAANQLYPGLARRIYLRAFRYSLHMMPLSTLVEVGNQHNTRQQAKNAMYPLADIIAAVVLGCDVCYTICEE
ncbi:MAG: stage II sporulation protein P [Firmicutes bacterium]|nr:stage II sporulation protein P [Bacillota bacterium]